MIVKFNTLIVGILAITDSVAIIRKFMPFFISLHMYISHIYM